MVNLTQQEALLNYIEKKCKKLEAYAQTEQAKQTVINIQNADLAELTMIYNQFEDNDKTKIANYVFNEIVTAVLKVNPNATQVNIQFDIAFEDGDLKITNYKAYGI
jgi:hypothetical protein